MPVFTLHILNEIKPKFIIAEGFKTFERLKKLLKGTEQQVINFNNNKKAILVIGKTHDSIPLIGMIHPSGARGISDLMLIEIGYNLKKIINQ